MVRSLPRIDWFGLRDWWPRPKQAAAGALDHLPPDQWPRLAKKWLAARFDSEPLRQLAQLQTGGSPTALDAMKLMPEVLRSLGFDPAPADEEFMARCGSAVDIVQHDLDATGYGRYQMRACFGGGWPSSVYAALPDGSYWGGGEGMSREMEGSWLLACAADSVSSALKEIPEVEWPVCAIHGGHPEAIWDGEDPVGLIKKVAWWRCTNTGHPLAPVGQLTAETARAL